MPRSWWSSRSRRRRRWRPGAGRRALGLTGFFYSDPDAEASRAQVLLEFPIEVVSALVAGRWAASASASRPFLAGYRLRLGMAAVVTTMVRPRCAADEKPCSMTVNYHGAPAMRPLIRSITTELVITMVRPRCVRWCESV